MQRQELKQRQASELDSCTVTLEDAISTKQSLLSASNKDIDIGQVAVGEHALINSEPILPLYSALQGGTASNCEHPTLSRDILVERITGKIIGAVSTGLRDMLRSELSDSLKSTVDTVLSASCNARLFDAVPVLQSSALLSG